MLPCLFNLYADYIMRNAGLSRLSTRKRVHSPGKTLLAFALFHFVLQGQICLLLQVTPRELQRMGGNSPRENFISNQETTSAIIALPPNSGPVINNISCLSYLKEANEKQYIFLNCARQDSDWYLLKGIFSMYQSLDLSCIFHNLTFYTYCEIEGGWQKHVEI